MNTDNRENRIAAALYDATKSLPIAPNGPNYCELAESESDVWRAIARHIDKPGIMAPAYIEPESDVAGVAWESGCHPTVRVDDDYSPRGGYVPGGEIFIPSASPIGAALFPEQAREFAAALLSAADYIEGNRDR